MKGRSLAFIYKDRLAASPSHPPSHMALARCSEYEDSETERTHGGHPISKPKASKGLAAILTGTSPRENRGTRAYDVIRASLCIRATEMR